MKFSIITITYNAERWIEKTLLSVLGQNYNDIEYILVDGASTDRTMALVEKYKDQMDLCISEPDKGLYDAMNKGIANATGDYIWFINAGDTFHSPDTVKLVAQEVNDYPHTTSPDILYGETEIINEKGENLGKRRLKTPKTLTWKSFRMGMLVCHQSFVVKRIIAPRYNLSYRYSADVDWCIRCMKKASLIVNTEQTLSHFLDGGLSSSQRKDSLKERFHIMCHYYGTLSTLTLHLWFALRFHYAKWIKKRV